MANVKSVRGKLTFPPSLKPCGFIHSGRMIICRLQIMTSSLAGERPPVRPAYFKPSAQPHCPGAFLTAESTCEVRFYFFFQSRWKRRMLIETYLTCGISLLCVNEGEGQGPPTPVSPCSLGECGWDTKGLIRCLGVGGAFPGFVSRESHDGFRAFLAGVEQKTCFQLPPRPPNISPCRPGVPRLIINRFDQNLLKTPDRREEGCCSAA